MQGRRNWGGRGGGCHPNIPTFKYSYHPNCHPNNFDFYQEAALSKFWTVRWPCNVYEFLWKGFLIFDCYSKKIICFDFCLCIMKTVKTNEVIGQNSQNLSTEFALIKYFSTEVRGVNLVIVVSLCICMYHWSPRCGLMVYSGYYFILHFLLMQSDDALHPLRLNLSCSFFFQLPLLLQLYYIPEPGTCS